MNILFYDLLNMLEGKKDGQTKMIKRDGKVELYHWDTSETEWKKIGDVVGSSQDKEQASTKTMYEGKVGIHVQT